MDITVMQAVANIAGSGSVEALGVGFWGSGDVIEDDFGYFDSASGSLLLPAGWHDVGVSVASQDGDFSVTTKLEVLLGRANGGTPSWGQWREMDLVGVARPRRTMRGAVKFPVEDAMAIGLMHDSGTSKDLVVQVQIFN